jgi:transposase-like protein
MAKKSQNRYSAQEKAKILQEGSSGSTSINEVCRRYGIPATTYHTWRKQANEAILNRFSGKTDGRKKASKREKELEDENKRLKHTIVEIAQDNIDLKKKNSL